MSNQYVITTKVTEKKTGYLHEVFVNGELVGKRNANKRYKQAVVVRIIRERKAENMEGIAKFYEEEAKKGHGEYYTQAAVRIRREIQDLPETFPMDVLSYSNTGKYSYLDSGIYEVIGYANF